jgi:hypothetical protein
MKDFLYDSVLEKFRSLFSVLEMSRYIDVRVHISEEQKAKIKQAIEARQAVSIRSSHSDLNGEHLLVLTQAQVNKMMKAYENMYW